MTDNDEGSVYAKAENAIMEGFQYMYREAHGSEPMPAKIEAMASAFTSLLVDCVMSLDTIARSAQMVADKLESESVAQD